MPRIADSRLPVPGAPGVSRPMYGPLNGVGARNIPGMGECITLSVGGTLSQSFVAAFFKFYFIKTLFQRF